jgi:hypothetical protein
MGIGIRVIVVVEVDLVYSLKDTVCPISMDQSNSYKSSLSLSFSFTLPSYLWRFWLWGKMVTNRERDL